MEEQGINLGKDRIGEIELMNCGDYAKIIEYRFNNDIDVIFEIDDTIVKSKSYNDFKKGAIRNPNCIKRQKEGEKNKNFYGEEMTLVKYVNTHNIFVKFTDGNIVNCEYNMFKKGCVKNPFFPSVKNKGFMGEGIYNNKKHRMAYKLWYNIFVRVCDVKELEKHPTYKNCSICEKWLNFQNFAKWYYDNIWGDNIKFQVDKDILIKGNKIYSPDTCILVDQRLNKLFLTNKSKRNNLIGTTPRENGDWLAKCNVSNERSKHIGVYNTEIEAFQAYKAFKENYIKQVADEYKQKYPNFPQKLYDAMYNYEVEITD